MAAGIGSGEGNESSCGDIIIADDADIDSTKGEGAVNDLGQGDPESECGDVINEKVVKEITLDKTTLSMSLGDQPVTLTATINPEEVADKTLIWSSSDEKVVTVDAPNLLGKKHKYRKMTSDLKHRNPLFTSLIFSFGT